MTDDEGPNLCPTPKKMRFATLETAQDVADRATVARGRPLYPYDTCVCGWVHLTSKKNRLRLVEPVLPTIETVGDPAFAKLIRDEVLGFASVEDAEALRRPENLMRWSAGLKEFNADLHKQLALKAGMRDPETMAWRKRLSVVQHKLQARRLEVKQLCYEHITVGGYTGCKASVNPAKVDLKDLRREAGEKAIDRLIEAHRAEFARYLIEECDLLGVEIPKAYEKYRHQDKDEMS